MKTQLFALSVLSAACCTAQAQSSVTVYGVLDSFLELASAGNGTVTRASPAAAPWVRASAFAARKTWAAA